jgi:DNA-binding NarL/FixJ family response regulator
MQSQGSSSDKEHQLTVVLADDNREVRDQLRLMLADEFEILDLAENGTELLEKVRQRRPDLVVCDVEMPGMSGIDAGRRMLREGLCQAVVAITVYRERHLVEKALSAGIRGFVLKMDAAAELLAAVRSVAGGETYLSRGVRKTDLA